ncbi:MAG: type 4b pilus protein PilO2 [Alphaproteobacteria bacterium]|nr:type 4b pilus protein PilO2 [Alphaproteobacteria bacterium]
MASKIINVNRRKYAVGLFWQPIAAGFVARNYARSLSRNIDKRLNLYLDYRSMIALGARRWGHRAGMASAAAEVMAAFSEYTSFLSVFRVDGGFYLVAARNGIVIEDKIFDSESEARSEYVKLSEIPDWGAFFAPGDWGMPRAVDKNISDVLVGAPHVVLHSISRLNAWLLSAALVVFFILGLVGVLRDPIVQTVTPRPQVAELNPELVAEYKKQLEEKNKELDVEFEIEKTLPPEPIVMPYELLPDAGARAEMCYKAIGFLMQPVAGWNQINVECGETHAFVIFQRSFGTLADFYQNVAQFMPGVFVQEVDENTVRVRTALPILETLSSQDERDAETLVRDVTSVFQAIDTNIQTEIVVDTLTNGVDVATVNVVELSVQTKLVPMQFMEVLADFGGVYMTKCTWNVKTRVWNYEVIIYAK